MKRGFTLAELIGVVIILALIALLAFPPILNSIRKTKIELSDASKEILYNATSLYVSDNSNDFRKINGNTFCVTLNTLVSNEYLPTIVYDSVTGEEISLDSKIEVKVENDGYTYNMNNDCVEVVQKTLIENLIMQYSDSNTTGLLKDENNSNLYYYKGTNEQVNNNYLWYGGHQWRVLEFNIKDQTLTLITSQPITNINYSYSMWNSEEEYTNSYVNKWLNNEFYNSLSGEVKSNILQKNFNIGMYNNVHEKTTIQKVGLLDAEQYTKAGGNNSYLDIKDDWWLGNRYDESNVTTISNKGEISGRAWFNSMGIRPVIKIKDIIISSGKGSLQDSFKTSYISNNTEDVLIGEYISVPTTGNECGSDKRCLFRVVKKENGAIKVILNGILSQLSIFGPNATITKEHDIYKYIESFANSISLQYRSDIEQKIYMGKAEYINCENGENYCGFDYEEVRKSYLESSFGLPTYGEMFTANDIDLVSYNIFVDKNTIENPIDGYAYHNPSDPSQGLGIWYYLMNEHTTGCVMYINSNGYFACHQPNTNDAVRPVIFLKNNLTFTGGDGTAQNPYTLD